MDAIGELEVQAKNGHPHAVHAALDAVREAIANVKPKQQAAPGGSPLPEGGMGRVIRDFREGRTTDGRTRGPMQQANEAFRRKRQEERRQVQSDWTPTDAASPIQRTFTMKQQILALFACPAALPSCAGASVSVPTSA